jgi:PAS domain S-box-containing protein
MQHSNNKDKNDQELLLLGNLFWNVFNTSNNAILLLQDYKITDSNPMAQKMFGAQPFDLIGKTPYDLSPEFQPDGTSSEKGGIEIFNSIFDNGVVNFEWWQRKLNGEIFLASITATSFKYNNQYYVSATIQDITVARKEQQELQSYRKRLEQMVEEKTNNLALVNQELQTLNEELDTTNEELDATNEELMATNEELATTNEELETINAELEKEIALHKETLAKKIILEEKLNQFIYQASNGIIVSNSQGVIEEWNDSMTELTGIGKSEALGTFIWDIVGEMALDKSQTLSLSERFKKQTLEFFVNIDKYKVNSIAFETQIRHRDLSVKHIQITLFPVVTQSGNYAGNIINDITQKKEIEFQLEKYRTQLENILAEKTERLVQISERFKEIYANTSEAITFIDILDDGSTLKVFDMNAEAKKLFSVSPERIEQGLYAADFIPKSNYQAFVENLLPAIHSGESVVVKEQTELSSGYWHSTITPIKNKEGKVYRIVIFSKNVTAEYEREKMSVILQSAIDSWPFEFWVRDNEGRQILQNKISYQKRGNLIGKKIEDIEMPAKQRVQGLELIHKALKGESLSFEIEIEEDGQKKYVVYKLNPIISNNKIEGMTGLVLDITDRKLAEDRIKASEAQYRLLAENIDDVIWKMDVNTLKYTFITPSIYKLTGFTVEESLNQSFEEMLMPDSLAEALEELPRRMAQFYEKKLDAEVRKYRFKLRCKDGHAVWVEMNTSFLTDVSGQITEIVASSRNITEQKAAEEQIKQMAELHQTILDTTDVGLLHVKNHKMQWANSAFYKMFGLELDDIFEKDTRILYLNENFYEEIRDEGWYYTLLAKGEVYTNDELLARRKDGTTFWLSLNGKAINPQKLEDGSIWMFQNISSRKHAELELKKSESVMKATMESMNDGILVILSDGTITHFNKRFQQLFSLPDELLSLANDAPVLNYMMQQMTDPVGFLKNVSEIYKTDITTEDTLFLNNGLIIERLSFPLTYEKQLKGRVWVFRDVTERKRTENALHESEKRLQQLLSSVTDYTYTETIENGKVVRSLHGEGCRTVTGYKPEDYIINPYLWYEMVHDEDKKLIEEWTKQILNGNDVNSVEHRIIHKDGEIRWVRNTVVLKKNASGVLIGYDGLVSDITKRKIAEMLIRESDDRFRKITRLTKHLVYDYNPQANTIKWDGAIEEVTGFTSAEYEHVGIDQWAAMIHPEDRDGVLSIFNESIANGSPYRMQYRYKNKNNEYRWIDEDSYVYSSANKTVRVLGVMKDITEQKRVQTLIAESEMKLRTIFNTSKDGIILLNRNMEIIDINHFALQHTGYTRDEVLGESALGLLLKEDIPITPRNSTELWNVEVIDNFETEIIIKGDGYFPVEVRASAIRIEDEDALLLMVRDISERRKLEKELLHSVINTEERERLHFSQELHDGLGPLLSAAKLYTEWLADPNSNVNPQVLIPDIQKLLEESNRSIREISFKLSPHILQNYGVAEALKAYAEKVEKTGKTHIDIVFSSIPRFDEIAETIVFRVVCECINNTLKHARAKSLIINLFIEESFLSVSYFDDGKGFEVDRILAERKGIGLLNMQSRLKSINGQFSIESALGKGTRIFIKVPLKV